MNGLREREQLMNAYAKPETLGSKASASEMRDALDNLHDRISRMGELVGVLEGRLSPILRSEPPTATKTPSPTGSSPITAQLYDMNVELARLYERIAEINERLVL